MDNGLGNAGGQVGNGVSGSISATNILEEGCSDPKCKDPIYPNKNDPKKSCPSNDGGTNNMNFGNNPTFRIVGVYDFDNKTGRPNVNIVVRFNNKNDSRNFDGFGSAYGYIPQDIYLGKNNSMTHRSRLNRLQNQTTITVDGSNDNLLIRNDVNNPAPFYTYLSESKEGKESTNMISFESQIKIGNKHYYKDLKEEAKDSRYNEYESKIISDLSNKNIFNMTDSNNISVNNFQGNKDVSFSCCVASFDPFTKKLVTNIAVIGVDLKNVYKNLKSGESTTLNIKINKSTFKLKLTKKRDSGNWEVECVG